MYSVSSSYASGPPTSINTAEFELIYHLKFVVLHFPSKIMTLARKLTQKYFISQPIDVEAEKG